MNRSLNEDSRHKSGSAASVSPADRPLRGVYVHRMGENADDERAVADFFRAHDLEVEGLEDPTQRFSRLPDLRILRDGTPWALCEVKTLWQHSWIVHILHEDRPVEERRETTNKSLKQRVGDDLILALRQLNAGNPGHELLNFVVLVNRDREVSPAVFTELLERPLPEPGRSLKARIAEESARQLANFRQCIDFCLWANPQADGKLSIERCFLFNPSLRSFAEEITGLRGNKLISLEPAA